MSNPTVVEFFRPVVIFCSVLGNMCELSISNSNVKYFSYPVIAFYAFFMYNVYIIVQGLSGVLNKLSPLMIHHTAIYVFNLLWPLWISLGSKNIMKSFQIVDQMRNSLTQVPPQFRCKLTNPIVFSGLVMTILIAVHFILVFPFYILTTLNVSSLIYVFMVLNFPYRQSALYSCVYYSCALIVYDSRTVWRRYSRMETKPRGFILYFGRLINKQIKMFKEVDELLQNYIFGVLAYRVLFAINHMFYAIGSDFPVVVTFLHLINWTTILALLLLTINLTSEQFNEISQEVLLSPNYIMSKREKSMIRVLLEHLDNQPGMFTVGGFVEGRPSLLLTFTALGIEYLILFVQNVDQIRQRFGLSPTIASYINSTNITITDQ